MSIFNPKLSTLKVSFFESENQPQMNTDLIPKLKDS